MISITYSIFYHIIIWNGENCQLYKKKLILIIAGSHPVEGSICSKMNEDVFFNKMSTDCLFMK